MKQQINIPLGPFGEGSLRIQDLVATALSIAEVLKVKVSRCEAERLLGIEEISENDAETLGWILDETLEKCNDKLGFTYTWCGSHPDQPDSYGIWLNHEMIEEDLENGDLVEVQSEEEIGKIKSRQVVAALLRSASGDTLYRLDGKKIWSWV